MLRASVREAKARAGVVVMLGHDGLARFERGLVRVEDVVVEPPPEDEAAEDGGTEVGPGAGGDAVEVEEAPPSLSKALRKKPDQMAVITEDLIKLLDGIGNGYRHGRHPDPKHSRQIAMMLRKVADELELSA